MCLILPPILYMYAVLWKDRHNGKSQFLEYAYCIAVICFGIGLALLTATTSIVAIIKSLK